MRFAHTGDLHLGVPLKKHDRLDEHFLQLERIVAKTIELRCEALLIAGDLLYERAAGISLSTILGGFVDRIIPLVRARVQVIILQGNHDQREHFELMQTLLRLAAAAAQMEDLAESLVRFVTNPSVIEMPSQGAGAVQCICLPYPTTEWILARMPTKRLAPGSFTAQRNQFVSESYVAAYRQLLATTDPTRPVIVAAHFTVDTASIPVQGEGFRYNWDDDFMFPQSEFSGGQLSYVALAHIHERQRFAGTSCPMYYCGSPVILNAAERDSPKGFLVVDVVAGEGTRVLEVDLPTSPVLVIECTEAALEGVIGRMSEMERRSTLVKCIITHSSAAQSPTIKARVRAAFPRHYGIEVRYAEESEQTRAAFTTAAVPTLGLAVDDYRNTSTQYIEEVFAGDPNAAKLLALHRAALEGVARQLAGEVRSKIDSLDLGFLSASHEDAAAPASGGASGLALEEAVRLEHANDDEGGGESAAAPEDIPASALSTDPVSLLR
jgi:exonuclease SbcD